MLPRAWVVPLVSLATATSEVLAGAPLLLGSWITRAALRVEEAISSAVGAGERGIRVDKHL